MGRKPALAMKAEEGLLDACEHLRKRRYASAALCTMVALSHIVDLAPGIKAEVTKLTSKVYAEGDTP